MESRFWEIKKLCGDSGPAMASSGYNSRPTTAHHATRALYSRKFRIPKMIIIMENMEYGIAFLQNLENLKNTENLFGQKLKLDGQTNQLTSRIVFIHDTKKAAATNT